MNPAGIYSTLHYPKAPETNNWLIKKCCAFPGRGELSYHQKHPTVWSQRHGGQQSPASVPAQHVPGKGWG